MAPKRKRLIAHDKKVKVTQAYLNSILEENERLNNGLISSAAQSSHDEEVIDKSEISSAYRTPATPATPRADDADRNPIIAEQPWFVPLKTADLPVHIGEAADAAFATRLRQAVSGSSATHLPRVHYMSDDVIRALHDNTPQWPSASRLRFLVDVALKTICTRWHIVRRSTVLAKVENLIQQPASCDWITHCSIWALIAIGDAFSSRCTMPGAAFPGARYWAKAMSLMSISPERPRLEVVEIYLLLACYASCLNRRHTSITLASHAVRICVILGLHLEIDQSQLQDAALREHRCRLWWTAYRFDRMWASKIGWPPSIPDDSIEISLPSTVVDNDGDFEDADYTIAALRLAGMLNSAISTLYVRRRHAISFTERVQAAVRALRDWSEALPSGLRLNDNDLPDCIPGAHLYLHLAFSQGVIVISRPLLLHVLKQQRADAIGDAKSQALSESAMSLAMACVRRARQSLNLLSRAWADGTFQTFDYFYTQFLFSASTILGLSALLRGPSWDDDKQDFLLGLSFLHQLERNGNFGAREFCVHADAFEKVLQEDLASSQYRSVETNATNLPNVQGVGQTAFAAEPLQDFLNDSALDLEFIDLGPDQLDWQDMLFPDLPVTQ